MKRNGVDILLSTYNGERYLKELLNSIIHQTYTNWKIIVRDDGSSDDTRKILNAYESRYPDQIIIMDDPSVNLGSAKSFIRLLSIATAPYIMFCDQDDIWLPGKIETTLQRMLDAEAAAETFNKPMLVHTDLVVVNHKLETVHKSFWKFQNLNPQKTSLNNLLVQNNVTGCTMMINKVLKDLVINKDNSFPSEGIMHDWWIALIASSVSGIYYVDQATILYRQHSANVLGAQQYSFKMLLNKIAFFNNAALSVKKTVWQARAFLKLYSGIVEEKQYSALINYSEIINENLFKRYYKIFRYTYSKQGMLRQLGFLLIMACIEKEK